MSQVKLGDVAVESRETYKGDKTGMPIVGLEHITPGEVTLSNWDTDTDNTFTKRFRKGDMLFGRRRAYLKKAAQAPFDGICSGDITVIRAKEDRLLPEMLPFIIQNDNLFDFAVGKSAGSLSPRVKWDNLKNYTFELPPMEEQKKLAEALWSINDTLQAYQKLFTETDALVQAQFVEMFGDPRSNPKGYPIKRICDYTQVLTGATPNRKNTSYYGGSIPWVKTGEIEAGYIVNTEEYITETALQETNCKILPVNTVMIAMYGQGKTRGCSGILGVEAATNQACAAILPCKELNPNFLHQFFINEYSNLRELGRGAQQANLNLSMIKNYPIMDVPLEFQNIFDSFIKQSASSKAALQNTVAILQAAKRAILEDALRTRRKE